MRIWGFILLSVVVSIMIISWRNLSIELKQNTKTALRKNLWIVLLVFFVLFFTAIGFSTFSFKSF